MRRVLPSTHEEAYRIMERYKADLAQRAKDEELLQEGRSEADEFFSGRSEAVTCVRYSRGHWP